MTESFRFWDQEYLNALFQKIHRRVDGVKKALVHIGYSQQRFLANRDTLFVMIKSIFPPFTIFNHFFECISMLKRSAGNAFVGIYFYKHPIRIFYLLHPDNDFSVIHMRMFGVDHP